MRSIRFMAALVLICTNSLFAGGSSSDPVSNSGKKAESKYVIEPPDVIQIEIHKLIPKKPRSHLVDVFDVLQIRAKALSDQPIDNCYTVGTDGTINLGPTYGSVRVTGMTIDEIRTTLNESLHRWIKDPSVSVQLARVSGVEPLTGQYRVGFGGLIYLRSYGVLKIAGKTVTEARVAIQDHLKQYLDSPELSVDVVACNSKVYYVITQVAGRDDKIQRLPITGNETVLDAIAQVDGLSQISSKKIWIARSAPRFFGCLDCQQILPIEWDAIVQGAQTATNYQLLPRDRVYILWGEEKEEKKDAREPERISGVCGSGSTIHGYETMGSHYNATRNGL